MAGGGGLRDGAAEVDSVFSAPHFVVFGYLNLVFPYGHGLVVLLRVNSGFDKLLNGVPAAGAVALRKDVAGRVEPQLLYDHGSIIYLAAMRAVSRLQRLRVGAPEAAAHDELNVFF